MALAEFGSHLARGVVAIRQRPVCGKFQHRVGIELGKRGQFLRISGFGALLFDRHRDQRGDGQQKMDVVLGGSRRWREPCTPSTPKGRCWPWITTLALLIAPCSSRSCEVSNRVSCRRSGTTTGSPEIQRGSPPAEPVPLLPRVGLADGRRLPAHARALPTTVTGSRAPPRTHRSTPFPESGRRSSTAWFKSAGNISVLQHVQTGQRKRGDDGLLVGRGSTGPAPFPRAAQSGAPGLRPCHSACAPVRPVRWACIAQAGAAGQVARREFFGEADDGFDLAEHEQFAANPRRRQGKQANHT